MKSSERHYSGLLENGKAAHSVAVTVAPLSTHAAEVVVALLRHGAQASAENVDGESVVDFAKRHSRPCRSWEGSPSQTVLAALGAVDADPASLVQEVHRAAPPSQRSHTE
eukprot:3954184-Amphidinium_carterae.1